MLTARGLRRSYRRGLVRRRQPVLRSVDLELLPGQVVGVIGENWSGKSTLMKIVVGALHAEGHGDRGAEADRGGGVRRDQPGSSGWPTATTSTTPKPA